jgi:hypothetical protein
VGVGVLGEGGGGSEKTERRLQVQLRSEAVADGLKHMNDICSIGVRVRGD